jgi:hypothetical protein
MRGIGTAPTSTGAGRQAHADSACPQLEVHQEPSRLRTPVTPLARYAGAARVVECTCVSIRPGIRKAPRPSIRCARRPDDDASRASRSAVLDDQRLVGGALAIHQDAATCSIASTAGTGAACEDYVQPRAGDPREQQGGTTSQTLSGRRSSTARSRVMRGTPPSTHQCISDGRESRAAHAAGRSPVAGRVPHSSANPGRSGAVAIGDAGRRMLRLVAPGCSSAASRPHELRVVAVHHLRRVVITSMSGATP